MITRRTNLLAESGRAECPGYASLRAHIARLDEEVRVLRALIRQEITERKLASEHEDIDGNPRPPGAWTTIKKAAGDTGYSESGIRAMMRRGALGMWSTGGRVLVNIEGLPEKVRKNSERTFANPGMIPSQHGQDHTDG
jgi:hypothetical protein